MKKLVILLMICLMLAGCGETTVPAETQAPTEPPKPWIETAGTPWDSEGILTELPLTIPDGLHYTSALAFDGDLLLWSVDDHRGNPVMMEFCLIELDTGEVSAEAEIELAQSVYPQVMGASLFLNDSTGGKILQLDKQLQVINSWNVLSREGNFYMGADEILYIYSWSGSVTQIDLKTGVEKDLIPGGPYVDYFSVDGTVASASYVREDTGAMETILLDLTTNSLMEVPVTGDFTTMAALDGTWLMDNYNDSITYILGREDSGFHIARMGYDSLRLISSDLVLCSREDGQHISLHDLSGSCLAQAQLTVSPYSYSVAVVIPSDTFGGYFLVISDYTSSIRLLYWNADGNIRGENIPFEVLPEPGEQEQALRQRVEELEVRFGLQIFTGTDAGTVFIDFSAAQVTDWLTVQNALDVLENALSRYPDGFLQQLRYGDMRNLQIHLVADITSTNSEYVDVYDAFVQYNYDGHLICMDINRASEETYFHEISHVIDSYLEWDSRMRDDALFSEADWDSLNPDWFQGYTYDYSWRRYVEDYSYFVDDYSTIKPTEDRARVMEYAMADYGSYTFEGCDGLLAKLSYYARCIRDAFDTTGWPEVTLWEQYLP